ncbi:hypothetical protein HELRODRAFT_170795 [Helobdella robusta]|uniref:Uncharacterized protein n=1 Tax=Helobdella robusta TaxID=6412 RepID=T1F3F8_HELRO|nr:hypothetical protein HELRODRAFT_170795 [Helobdella robusta]ESO06779.1 hypothetical protein HELRODRAFT_170795 [Helobdella robusta]
MHNTNDDSAASMGEQAFIDPSHDSQLPSSPSSSSYVHSMQSSSLKVADNDSSFCDSNVDVDDDEVAATSSSPPKQSTHLTLASTSPVQTSTVEPSVSSTSLPNGRPTGTSSTILATSSSSSSSSSLKSPSLSALFSKTTNTSTPRTASSATTKITSHSQQQSFSSKSFVKTFPTPPKPPSTLSSFTSFLQSAKFLNTAIMSTTTILAFPMCIALNEGNEEPNNKENPQQDCKPAECVQKQQQQSIPTTNISTETISTQESASKKNDSNGQVQVYLSNSLTDLQNVNSHSSNDDNVEQLSRKSSSQFTLNTNAHDGSLLTIDAQLNNNTNNEKHSNPDLHLSQPIPICMVSSPSPPLPLTTKPPTFPVKSSVVTSKSSPASSSTPPKSVTLPTHVLPPHILAAKNSATRRSLGFVQRKMADKKKLSVSIRCSHAYVDTVYRNKKETCCKKTHSDKQQMNTSVQPSSHLLINLILFGSVKFLLFNN